MTEDVVDSMLIRLEYAIRSFADCRDLNYETARGILRKTIEECIDRNDEL